MSLLFNTDSLESMISFIVATYHSTLREQLDPLLEETKAISQQYKDVFPEIAQTFELLKQFRSEVMTHIDREEMEFFPVLTEIEQTSLGFRSFNDCDLAKFEATIQKLQAEHEHFDTYVYDFVDIFEGSRLGQENPTVFKHFLSIFKRIESETREHTELENTKLHTLALKSFLKVCNLKPY